MQNTETNYLKTTATNCEHIANIQQAFEGCKLSRLLLDRLWWIQTNAAALGGGDGGLDKLCVSCSNTFHKSCISCSDTFQHQASRTKRSHAWKSPKVPPCQNADSGQLWTIQHFGWLEPGLSDRPCSKDLWKCQQLCQLCLSTMFITEITEALAVTGPGLWSGAEAWQDLQVDRSDLAICPNQSEVRTVSASQLFLRARKPAPNLSAALPSQEHPQAPSSSSEPVDSQHTKIQGNVKSDPNVYSYL